MSTDIAPTEQNIEVGNFLTWILPASLVVVWVVAKIFFTEQYVAIIQEDGVLENLQALLYCLTAIACLPIGKRFLDVREYRFLGILYLSLAAVLLLASLEEISWGQRIFDIETPDTLMEINTQQEISIHNLKPVQSKLHLAYILVGLFCFTGWRLLKIPAVRNNRFSEFIIPDKSVRFYFLPVFVVYTYSDYLGNRLWNFTGNIAFRVQTENNILLWRDQEPAELFLTAGFFMFAINNLARQKARLNL